jgi:uroporphyrinogen decarboxylase
MREPLTREQVKKVINGEGAADRIPLLIHKWIYPNAFKDPETRARLDKLLADFPQDAAFIRWRNIGMWDAPDDAPDFRWMNGPKPDASDEKGIDADAPLSDWAMLDDILEHFPSANYPGLLPDNPPEDGRYRVGHWWYNFFERHWSLRGMSNALMDYYTNPEEVHRLFSALTDFYIGVMKRMKAEGADAIYTTDDLGTQDGPFFSPEIFDEFYAPYYKREIEAAHEMDMHFWLHTCGDVDLHLPKLIDLGLDVIHPIQKFAMSAEDTVAKYGGKICFWGGFDVQQTIPFGTVEEVRAEVRQMFDTYSRPDGRFMFTLGNGATPDTPIPSLEALFDEAYTYGQRKD